jgi:hypothetical protein
MKTNIGLSCHIYHGQYPLCPIIAVWTATSIFRVRESEKEERPFEIRCGTDDCEIRSYALPKLRNNVFYYLPIVYDAGS